MTFYQNELRNNWSGVTPVKALKAIHVATGENKNTRNSVNLEKVALKQAKDEDEKLTMMQIPTNQYQKMCFDVFWAVG